MRTDRPILAAFAMDDEDQSVAETAAAIALKLDAPILPVHAVVRSADGVELPEQIEAARTAILERLSAVADEHTPLLAAVIARSDPSGLVADAARASQARMVVVGSGERETVRRWLFGAVAEHIARNGDLAVWFTRGEPPEPGSVVACAVSSSTESREALEAAVRIARAFGTRLRILHVVRAPRTPVVGRRSLARAEARMDAAAEETAEALGLADDPMLQGLETEVVVVGGRVGPELAEHARDASLLVLGSDGLTHMHAGRLGPITEMVVRRSPCSVLVVRGPGAALGEPVCAAS